MLARSALTRSIPALRPHIRTAATAPKKSWSKPTATTTAAAAPTASPSSSGAAAAAATPAKNWGTANDFLARDEDLNEGMDDLLPEIPPNDSSTFIQAAASLSPASPSSSSSPPDSLGNPSYPNSNITFPSSPLGVAPVPAYAHTNPIEIQGQGQGGRAIDWSTSFHGMSSQPFSSKAAEILMRPLIPSEIEIKPDGLLYLPEILYRRILNKAFGPGGWGMVPRGEMTVMKNLVTREWGLVAGGRLVSVARGEQTYFDISGLPTATEGCKSNALMRCCKDLGIASELWDPAFIRVYKSQHCVEAWTEHASNKKRARRWRKKGNKFEYPLVEQK